MRAGPGLVAAFCTRGRPRELVRACESLAASVRESGQPLDAVLIVDGGALTSEEIGAVHAALAGCAARIEHVPAAGPNTSLYRSRVLALTHARATNADYVAFFDDDVELEPAYIGRLRGTLARERPAAIGGVDVLQRSPSFAQRAWQRLTGLDSGRAERLSSSGFAESQWRWRAQPDVFTTEYVSGCNMTLAVGVLDVLEPDAAAHFSSYSLGEDVALSGAAGRVGRVCVDPSLRVRHHQSPASREGRFETGRQLTSNLLWMKRRGMGPRSGVALGWTIAWLLARALPGDVRAGMLKGRAAGMLSGLREALRG